MSIKNRIAPKTNGKHVEAAAPESDKVQGNKKAFLKHAKTIQLPMPGGGSSAFALPREFSTGSMGWNINSPVMIVLENGELIAAKFSGNIIVTGSKDWE